jgi:hypothetical protein
MWVDGTKVIQYTGITYSGLGESNVWEEIRWNPTWGGAGGSIVTPFSAYMDHMYISGKNR